MDKESIRIMKQMDFYKNKSSEKQKEMVYKAEKDRRAMERKKPGDVIKGE